MTDNVRAFNQMAYRMGWNDGYTMATESGSAYPGPEGWDGLLINALGASLTEELIHEEEGSKGWFEALADYARGAQDGANTAVKDLEKE